MSQPFHYDLALEARRKAREENMPDTATFVKTVNESASLVEAAEKLGLKMTSVRSQASRLRKGGALVKKFKTGRPKKQLQSA